MSDDGARHEIVPGIFLGAEIDAEPDGQPTSDATGDDVNGLPDEDGVVFTTPLMTGSIAMVDVTASTAGWFDLWIDFDLDSSWSPSERVYSDSITAGLSSLIVTIPPTAAIGVTHARARYNTTGPLSPTGAAADGEVEDYEVEIEQSPTDFGDAALPYGVFRIDDGARHVIDPGVFLGTEIDAEADGQPSSDATGDDVNGIADEDGVVFTTPLMTGSTAMVDVTASTAGWFDLWIDFDLDSSWSPSERVYSDSITAGLSSLIVTIPPTAAIGTTHARARYNTTGPLSPTGAAADGEVEDYEVEIDQGTAAVFGEPGIVVRLNSVSPNPFLQKTAISFSVFEAEHVNLDVFTVRGRVVARLADRFLPAGTHRVEWTSVGDRGESLPSGVYFLRLQAGGRLVTKRVIHLR